MSVFQYQAEHKGKVIKGSINATSIDLAKIKLKSKNMDLIYIRPKTLSAYFSGGQSVKPAELLLLTRQLSFLLSSGLSLVQSLNMGIKMVNSLHLKTALTNILRKIEGGKGFAASLSMYPNIFDGFYVNMIKAAEQTGLLDKTLNDLTIHLSRSEAIKSKVKSAMTYPVLVIAISFTIILGIIYFVVPKFESIYSSMGGELPALTQLFVNLNHAMVNQWPLLVCILFGTPIGIWQFYKTESGRRAIQSLISLIPIFSKLQYKAALARYCRSFSSLLKAGISFLDALDEAANIAGHETVMKGLKFSKNQVSRGRSFTKGLKESGAFPELIVNMTSIGEESGRMYENYEKLTEFYEREVENTVTSLIKMIEPLLIVFLGGTIGLIIMALYLPVFNLGSVVN